MMKLVSHSESNRSGSLCAKPHIKHWVTSPSVNSLNACEKWCQNECLSGYVCWRTEYLHTDLYS